MLTKLKIKKLTTTNIFCLKKQRYSTKSNKNIAVLLSGCGFRDGAEITESVSVLIHITKNKSKYTCFSPNMDQSVVVNHATPFDPSNPQFVNEKRNILEESARISRGKIEELEKIDVNQHDALILPGGFGVPTSFGSNIGNPKEFKVHPIIEKVVRDFHSKGKPIGLICIAPAIGAKVLNASVAVPKYATGLIEALGGHPVEKQVTEIHYDEKNRLVSTAAYMYDDATSYEVFTGVGNLVDKVLELSN